MKIQSYDLQPGDLIILEVDANRYKQDIIKDISNGLPTSVHVVVAPTGMIEQATILQKGLGFPNENLYGRLCAPERSD